MSTTTHRLARVRARAQQTVPAAARVATAALLLTACQTEEAWEVIEEISVTWASDSDVGTDTVIGSGTNSTTTSETTDMTGSTTTVGPGGTNSATETGTSTGPTTGVPGVCGDGEVSGDEECDDGNDDNTDECLNSCEFPYCGDGIHGDDEECDDGNQDDDDGCNSACARDRVVFVTSETYQGNFGSVENAGSLCRQAALIAGLEDFQNFEAWLSDANSSPATTFLKSKGRYVLVDGTPIADNWADLTDGELHAPINLDENGILHEIVGVWSNTAASGETHFDSQDCQGWTVTNPMFDGRYGISSETDEAWTDYEDGPIPCGGNLRFYCFRQL